MHSFKYILTWIYKFYLRAIMNSLKNSIYNFVFILFLCCWVREKAERETHKIKVINFREIATFASYVEFNFKINFLILSQKISIIKPWSVKTKRKLILIQNVISFVFARFRWHHLQWLAHTLVFRLKKRVKVQIYIYTNPRVLRPKNS